MSPRSIALLIGGVFEAAAVVFFVAADDPYMAFMLAITGAGMCIMSFILLHAMTRGDGTEHAKLPSWKPLSRGAKSIFISNRNYDRAVELAKEMNGTALTFEAWEKAVHDVDIIISSTSVTETSISTSVNARRFCERGI